MQNYTPKLFIAFKMAYSCRFSQRENLDFLDFLQKKFYNINYWSARCGRRLMIKVEVVAPYTFQVQELSMHKCNSAVCALDFDTRNRLKRQRSGWCRCSKLGCFTRWQEIVFIFYLKSSKLPLNLLCYTAMPVFFQKQPKPAQLNILSLGVTMISMPKSLCMLFWIS